jgi:hypothetical protein
MGERRHMRDVVGFGVLGANGGDAGIGGFAGFGESIVTGIEVLAFLRVLGNEA